MPMHLSAVLRFDAELSLLDPRAFPPPSITLGAGSLEDEVAAAATIELTDAEVAALSRR